MNDDVHREPNMETPHAAAMVSDAFISFMHMRTELSDFVDFYHAMAKQAISREAGQIDEKLYGEYIGHSVYFLESYMTRISDLFDLYIEHLVYAVCLVKKEFLADREYDQAESRLKKLGVLAPTEDDVVFEAAVRFGQKDKHEICERFQDSIGFDIPGTVGALWNDVLFAKKVRNLIVHKASVMDERFVESARGRDCPFHVEVGVHLSPPETWFLNLASKIDNCIVLIDGAINDYVAVNKRNRYGHFWLPRSVWSNPLKKSLEKQSHGE